MSRFAILPTAVLRDPALTAQDKLIVTMLATYADENGYCWPAIKTLAVDAGVSESTVKRALVHLEEVGVVEREPRFTDNGDRDTNAYWIIGYDRRLLVGSHRTQGGFTQNPGVGSHRPTNKNIENKSIEHATTTAATDRALTFANPDHQLVYDGWRRASRLPAAFDASLRTLLEPITGGRPVSVDALGAAMLELAGNGEGFNLARLRGYLRKAEAGPPPEVSRGGYVSATFRASDDARRKLGMPPREPVQL